VHLFLKIQVENLIKEESREFARSEEDVLSYALFPQVAKDFLIKKYENE